MKVRRGLIGITLRRLSGGLVVGDALGGCLVCASSAQAVAPTPPQFVPFRFFFSARLGRSTLSSPRLGAAAAITGGKVLVAGGSSGTTTLKTLDLFNPAVHSPGTFKELPAQLSTPRRDGYAAPLPGGKVLIGGGSNQLNLDQATAEIYDPATGAVTPVTSPMTTARRQAWAAPLNDGRVLIGGGIDENNNVLHSAELFDPSTGTFTAVAQPMVDALAGATATTLPDGRVLIAGGWTTTTAPPTTAVEVYDPATEAFTKLAGGMLVPRSYAVTVALPDGNVLIAGGLSSPEAGPTVVERSAEIFTPEGSTSQELPVSGSTELTTARYDAVAALLPSGKVLIAGGGNATGQPLNSAELFEPAPEATVAPTSFGSHATGTTSTLSVTITNVGAQNLDVEGFSLGGPNPDDFSIGSSTCTGTPFGFQQTCKVDLHFTPSAAGSRVATVQLSDNEAVPLTFIIKGTGVTPSGGNGGSGPHSGSPVVSKVSIKPRRFRAGRGASAGTTISWRDSRVAVATLRILLPAAGRRAMHRCVAVTQKNRSHHRCTRYVEIGSLLHHDHQGRNTLRFRGLLGGHKLKPGRYHLALEATSGHGRSRRITKTFTITI